jgi:hypothetical protein
MRPSQKSIGWPIDKGNVLEMIADDMTIAEVMVLVDQGVV